MWPLSWEASGKFMRFCARTVRPMIETLTARRSRRFIIRLLSNPEVQFNACMGRFGGPRVLNRNRIRHPAVRWQAEAPAHLAGSTSREAMWGGRFRLPTFLRAASHFG